jgi:hypothetical protein
MLTIWGDHRGCRDGITRRYDDKAVAKDRSRRDRLHHELRLAARAALRSDMRDLLDASRGNVDVG